MEKRIEKLAKKINTLESQLFSMVEEMGQHMCQCNCNCEDPTPHNFCNTADDDVSIYCLNCGGYIPPEDC